MSEQKIIFISYSWESDKHKAWVKKFCDDLQACLGKDFKVLLDQNLTKGASYSQFMKKGLDEADKVLIIGTSKYKKKSEASGGVAYETMVITNKMMLDIDTTKFYPILRSGTFETSFPTDIRDRIGDDFRDDTKYNVNLQIVVNALIDEFFPQNSPSQNGKKQVLSFTIRNVSFNMIRVEGGTFKMGSEENDTEAFDDEKPSHDVKLPDYYIGETAVTQELWETVMNYNHSCFRGAKHPVENVSWDDCQSFIERLNKSTGKKFRLPTEAEWEFAARGGIKSKGYKYSGSNTVDDVAWYTDERTNNIDRETHDVACKKANELGLYDMSGNVWEWCSDHWNPNYYSKSPIFNPQEQEGDSSHVLRGGSWFNRPRSSRNTNRYRSESGCYFIGLRLALSE